MSVSRRERWHLALLALPLLLYCILPTRNYYWDGVAFAIDIEKHPLSAALLYPSHLIYESFGGWLYWLSQIAGFETRALFLMQGANCILAGIAIFLFDKCLRQRNVTPEIAVAWALVFGFSATWWRFASDANAYVPAFVLLLCADLLLEKNPLAAGLCTAAAMLFHELAILFVAVALTRLWPKPWKFLVTAIVPVALMYIIAYRSGPGGSTSAGFMSWVTWHSPDSSFSFHAVDNFGLSMRGTLRLFFGGRLGEFANDGISKAAVAALAVAVMAFLSAVLQRAPFLRAEGVVSAPRQSTSPQWPLLLWLAIYFVFLFFWMPQNTFYRMFYLAPLLLLAAGLFSSTAARSSVWLFVAVVALWNFVFLTYPQSRQESNAPLKFALAERAIWKPGTPIVYQTFHPDLWTISYFNQQAAWIGVEHPDAEHLDKLLRDAQSGGHSLWMEETAFIAASADSTGRHWVESHERRSELIRFKDDRHDFRFHHFR